MTATTRFIIFGVIALALGAGAWLMAANVRPNNLTVGERAGATCVRNPAFDRSKGLVKEWQPLVKQLDGSQIYFNPFTMSCDPATGRRLVWIEIAYPFQDKAKVEDEQFVQEITFTRDRYLYEIDCAAKTYVVLERGIVDEAGAVAHTERYTQAGGPLKPFVPGGVASTLAQPACSTGAM